MIVQVNLSTLLALLWLLLINIIIFVQGNCSNTVKNHVLHGKHFERLHNIDWLACIQSCNVHKNCYSYNFCFSESRIQLGTCELNDCWIKEDLKSRKSSLVFFQDCFFQQIPRRRKRNTACDKKNNGKNKARWIQTAMRPPTICLQTSTNVGFFIPATGYILSVRLTWQSGVISCNKDKDHCAAYWGCACYDHSKPTSTDTRLDIIITDHNSHKVFPDLKLPDQNDRIWYTLPDQTNEQQVLTFPNLTQPLRVRNGEKFIVWYSTHLLNPGPHWSKADGNVCFSVEVLFSQVDADDDHDPFLR